MSHIQTLWGEKIRSVVNDLKRPTREKIIKLTFFSVIGIAFIIFDYFFFKRVIDLLVTPKTLGGMDIELVGPILVDQLLTMINLTLFSVLTFSSVIASLSALYLSRDLDLLFSLPISHTEVFCARFVQGALNSSYMVIIFGLPIYFALGSSLGAGTTYYIGVVLVLIPFVIIPASIGTLITMILMRFFPARRTHQIMTIVGMVFAAGLIIFFRFLRPESLYEDISGLSQPVFMSVLEGFKVPRYPFLPSTWFSTVIGDMVGLTRGGMTKNLAFLIGGALTCLVVSLVFARFIYFPGVSKNFESRGKGVGTRVRPFMIVDRALKMLDIQRRAILVKDIKTMFRDPTQWSQLFLLAALIVMYLFSIKNIPADSDFLKDITSFLNLGLAGFVISALAVRFVFPTTSLEGQAYWIVFTAPLSKSEFLWAKFLIYVFPVVFLGELLIVCSNLILHVDSFMMILSVVTVFFFSVSLTAMGVGLGAVYPRFAFENAAEIAAGFGGIIYMIISLLYIGASIIIEARPVYVYFREQVVPGTYEYLSLVISIALLAILNAAVFFIPMKLGVRRLSRMEF